MLRASRRHTARGRRWPLGLVAVGLLLLAAVVAAAISAVRRSDNPGLPGKAAAAAKTPLEPVELARRGAFDPEGDGAEHTGDALKAADGNPATYWATEYYNDLAFGKSGVGLVLDAGTAAAPAGRAHDRHGGVSRPDPRRTSTQGPLRSTLGPARSIARVDDVRDPAEGGALLRRLAHEAAAGGAGRSRDEVKAFR